MSYAVITKISFLALCSLGCSIHINTQTWCYHGTIADVRRGGWLCVPGEGGLSAAAQIQASEHGAAIPGNMLGEAVKAAAIYFGVGAGGDALRTIGKLLLPNGEEAKVTEPELPPIPNGPRGTP